MYQEIESQKPIVISRNHIRPKRRITQRWAKPDDWSPAWNFQCSLITGLTFGVSASIYSQFHTPICEMLRFYQFPNNFAQFRIFMRSVFSMDSFRKESGTRLAFYSLRGLSFESARFYMWKNFAGGYPNDPDVVDVAWLKKIVTAFTVGVATCWIPVPFYNIQMRYEQDKIMPKEVSRGYRGYLHAAYSILKNDGVFPFIRGSGPYLAEKTLQTFGLFFWIDFVRDKLKHFRTFNEYEVGFNENYLRFISISIGVMSGIFYGYPMLMLKEMVEGMPRNSKGELYLETYSEALWKIATENVSVVYLWNGYFKYLTRVGPPLFITCWVADLLGLLEQYEVPGIVLPS